MISPRQRAGTSVVPAPSAEAGAPERKAWTVIYWGAGVAEPHQGLVNTRAILDLQQVGSDPNTHVVALNHREPWIAERIFRRHREYLGTRAYYVTRGDSSGGNSSGPLLRAADLLRSSPEKISSPEIPSAPVEPGDVEGFKSFVLNSVRKFPAQRYALIIPRMRDSEALGKALEEVAREIGHKIDLVDLNFDHANSLEHLYPLRNAAETLVASEDRLVGVGQPFGAVLEDLEHGIAADGLVTGADLAHLLVEESRRQPAGNVFTATLSAVDASRLEPLGQAVRDLHTTVQDQKLDPMVLVRSLSRSETFQGDPLRRESVTDLGSFTVQLLKRTDDPRIVAAVERVREALAGAVINQQHEERVHGTLVNKALRLALDKPTQNLSGMSGIGIYYDFDANGYGSRLQEIGGTATDQALGSSEFLRTMSLPYDESRSRWPWLNLAEAAQVSGLRFEQTIDDAARIPYAGKLSRSALIAAPSALFSALGLIGMPVGAAMVGTYLALRGVGEFAASGLAVARELGRPMNHEKVKRIVGDVADGVLGGAKTLTGLFLLGLIGTPFVWPFVATLGLKALRSAGKMLVERAEHKEFQREVEEFRNLSTAEKLRRTRSSAP
ncbi:MAG: hypothetical protein HY319_25935 [Armatimonadetes bacterium]|nr:hypothetical protein [Armatimonadota bacterium]